MTTSLTMRMTCHLLFQLTHDYKFDCEDDMSLVISADL